MRNRCPVIFQPSVYFKTTFLLLICSWLECRWGNSDSLEPKEIPEQCRPLEPLLSTAVPCNLCSPLRPWEPFALKCFRQRMSTPNYESFCSGNRPIHKNKYFIWEGYEIWDSKSLKAPDNLYDQFPLAFTQNGLGRNSKHRFLCPILTLFPPSITDFLFSVKTDDMSNVSWRVIHKFQRDYSHQNRLNKLVFKI